MKTYRFAETTSSLPNCTDTNLLSWQLSTLSGLGPRICSTPCVAFCPTTDVQEIDSSGLARLRPERFWPVFYGKICVIIDQVPIHYVNTTYEPRLPPRRKSIQPDAHRRHRGDDVDCDTLELSTLGPLLAARHLSRFQFNREKIK